MKRSVKMPHIGKNIRELRDHMDFEAKEFARLMGYTETGISPRYRNKNASSKFIIKAAQVLQVPVSLIFSEDIEIAFRSFKGLTVKEPRIIYSSREQINSLKQIIAGKDETIAVLKDQVVVLSRIIDK